ILLIMSYPPLVSSLVDIILNGDEVDPGATPEASPLPLKKAVSKASSSASIRTFQCPEQTLEESLVAYGVNTEGYMFLGKSSMISLSRDRPKTVHVANSKFYIKEKRKMEGGFLEEKIDDPISTVATKLSGITVPVTDTPLGETNSEVDSLGSVTPTQPHTTDERPVKGQNKELFTKASRIPVKSFVRRSKDFEPDRLFFDTLRSSLECTENDGEALFALCLIYAAIQNKGVDKKLLHSAGISSVKERVPYNEELVDDIIRVIEQGCRNGSRVRTVTVEMAIIVIKELVLYRQDDETEAYLHDRHLALVENIREASTLQLRHYYKEDEIFLDMFEDEYRQMKMKPLNIVHLMMDATLLLPITGTPLTGIEFSKRLPCGEVEHTRRAIRVFLMMRDLCLTLLKKTETRLPLSKVEYSVHLEDVLDLNNSDLISCTVQMEDKIVRRFLVIDEAQFILVEPDTSKLGWGVVKFVARLQDVETAPDKEDSRSLFITIHQPFTARSLAKVRSRPILSAKFIFDDYIRCMSAKQRLQRRRTMLKQNKLHNIAQLLELPAMATPPAHYYTITPPSYINLGSGKPYVVSPSSSQDSGQTGRERTGLESRDRADAFTTISGPEDCWSPSANRNKPRTTSQAQALAQVLEQSPPPGNNGVAEMRVSDNTIRTRSTSVEEEAEEALDMESTNGQNPLLARVREQESISDSSSSEPSSRRESIDNLRELRLIKFKSHSAPPTPRGGRHPPPLGSCDFGDINLLSIPCLSDPAFYVSKGLDEISNKNSAPKKTKSAGKKSNRKKRGHSRRRVTK
ncbi:protein CLEC16A-like, partial [Actinia tenebrosa]|uniref:Protein CLEC16A-like n=1 Tax=Actinia tenebrosa TaxID=6105 RepID=A0A6P8HXS2_ACTTE